MTIWKPNISHSGQARYIAIADEIEAAIHNQQLIPGSKLPPQRILADQLGVTVGTVTRAYAEAERRGLVRARVGSGTFINDSSQPLHQPFAPFSTAARSPIDFTQNLPVPNDHQAILSEVLQTVAQDSHISHYFNYQPEQGALSQRQWAQQWLTGQGIETAAEHITITCGGQHALMLALAGTTRFGDNILCESLAYPGLSAAASQLGIKVTGVPMDEQGLLPDKLEQLCQRGHYSALYCTPFAQNPTNAIMSTERRAAISAIARRHHLWIIEDAVLSSAIPGVVSSFHAIEPDISLYICSHSKILAGGLRVGYLVAPERLQENIANSIRAHCWFTAPLTVEIAQRWSSHPATPAYLKAAHQELKARTALAQEYLKDYECCIVEGSFHAWLKLPEPWRAVEFQQRLKEKEVGILAAEAFAVGSQPAPQAVRISLSSAQNRSQVEQGLKLISTELAQGMSTRLSVC